MFIRLTILGLALTRLVSHTVAADETSESKEAANEKQNQSATSDADEKVKEKKKPAFKPLFDGKSLKGWTVTEFPGHGEVYVEDGQLILRFGEVLTGITRDKKLQEKSPFPANNYEIQLQAQRVDGSDFFCALTFPVGKEFCSLVVGGWGGSVVGISSIDGFDASENSTTSFRKFKNKKWYTIRVRVTDKMIQCWIDKERAIRADRKNREFSVRWEVEESRPLGIAAYQSTAAIKDFGYRVLTKEELRKSREEIKGDSYQ